MHDKEAGTNKKDVVETVRKRLRSAWDSDRENRDEALTDLEFLAGNQWEQKDRDAREGRPTITVNRLPQFVRQVTNDIRQADVAIKVVPSDGAVKRAERVIDPKAQMQQGQGQGQPQGQMGPPPMGDNGGPPMQQPPKESAKPTTMADVLNGLIREIQYQSSASHVYATAAEHQTSCGIGHFRIQTDYVSDDVFDQEIRIEVIANPLSVYWDPAAVKIDRSDASWCIVTECMPTAAFNARYKKAAEESVDVPDDASNDLSWTTTDEVRVAEYWCRTPIKKEIAQLIDGRVVEITKKTPLVDIEDGAKAVAMDGMPVPVKVTREVDAYKIEQYVVSGTEILEGPTEWAGKYIPIIPVIGSEVPLSTRTMRYGLIRFARDPQRLYNYARSSAAEIMGQAPKSPYLVTTNMIGPFKRIWDEASKKLTPYLPYQVDPEAPGASPQRLPAPEVPVAFVQEAGVADGDIKATVGMYDPQLGQRSNESSGRAIMAREQQGDTGTFHYSDNLRRALEHAGRLLVDLIPKIYDNERVIRILGDDDSELYLPINAVGGYAEDGSPVYINDLTVGRYDCRVKIGPSYATKRMESADSMMQFMQAVPNVGALIGDLVAKNMDWPGSDAIAERLRRATPPEVLGEDAPQQAPDPNAEQAQKMQQDMMQAQLDEMQAKIAKLEADTHKAHADAERSEAERHKIEVETEMLPHEHDTKLDQYHTDREDREHNAEATRAQRLQEFSMRNTGPTNGAARQPGE